MYIYNWPKRRRNVFVCLSFWGTLNLESIHHPILQATGLFEIMSKSVAYHFPENIKLESWLYSYINYVMNMLGKNNEVRVLWTVWLEKIAWWAGSSRSHRWIHFYWTLKILITVCQILYWRQGPLLINQTEPLSS